MQAMQRVARRRYAGSASMAILSSCRGISCLEELWLAQTELYAHPDCKDDGKGSVVGWWTRFVVPVVVSTATQVVAAPPPPPSPETLTAVQTFIRASIDKDFPLYASLLSDQFIGQDAEMDRRTTRAEWLADTKKTFENKWLQTKVLHVFYGYHIVEADLQYRVMIVERLANYPDPPHSDCCTFYRVEVLVMDGGKIRKIGRSIDFMTELSDAGKRTDLPN